MTEQVAIWDKGRIQALLGRSDKAVVEAIKGLYERQTADEQASGETRVHNGRGFNSRDARFLSDVAQRLPQYGDRMTPKQISVARKMLPKYWRQLLEIAEAKGAQVDYGAKSLKSEPAEEPIREIAKAPKPQEAPVQHEMWGSF